jgi:hypothetical protein
MMRRVSPGRMRVGTGGNLASWPGVTKRAGMLSADGVRSTLMGVQADSRHNPDTATVTSRKRIRVIKTEDITTDNTKTPPEAADETRKDLSTPQAGS